MSIGITLSRGSFSQNFAFKISVIARFLPDETTNENEVLYKATNILRLDYRIQFVCIQVENKFESWIEIHNQTKTEEKIATNIIPNCTEHSFK